MFPRTLRLPFPEAGACVFPWRSSDPSKGLTSTAAPCLQGRCLLGVRAPTQRCPSRSIAPGRSGTEQQATASHPTSGAVTVRWCRGTVIAASPATSEANLLPEHPGALGCSEGRSHRFASLPGRHAVPKPRSRPPIRPFPQVPPRTGGLPRVTLTRRRQSLVPVKAPRHLSNPRNRLETSPTSHPRLSGSDA